MSVTADTVGGISNSAAWATSAGNNFRQVARETENPTTKLLAEGLTHLTEALRELDQKLEHIDTRLRSMNNVA
ncbi:hypothetical protein ACIA48_29965 [Mycobacterium sp. NPDC051804]|uniref:hypothetical protein n=1 Tax=Mycobacterium sp. NPDC051804 TaxID=3364295 RepID=UPI00379E9288